jgi:Zn-dependent protease
MFRFNLFGFPVEVRWQFWLVTAMLGGAMDARGPEAMRGLFVWMVVVFGSILLHELGHALAMRHFGDGRVNIVLHSFGGYAQGTRWLGRTEDIIISAAGPAASLLIGFIGWLVLEALPMRPGLLEDGLLDWKHVNLVWALVNLLPIIPLDGGHISAALHGGDRQHAALKLSFYFAAGVALFCVVVWQSLWNGMFFGVLAWNNWQQMNHRDQIRWMR